MVNNLLAVGPSVMASAPPALDLSVSNELQAILRGIAVLLIAVLLVLLLVKNMKFGRGGGRGSGIGAKTIIIVIVVAAMLMDVALFEAAVNWSIKVIYEVRDWLMDFLNITGGGSGGGSVNIG